MSISATHSLKADHKSNQHGTPPHTPSSTYIPLDNMNTHPNGPFTSTHTTKKPFKRVNHQRKQSMNIQKVEEVEQRVFLAQVKEHFVIWKAVYLSIFLFFSWILGGSTFYYLYYDWYEHAFDCRLC